MTVSARVPGEGTEACQIQLTNQIADASRVLVSAVDQDQGTVGRLTRMPRAVEQLRAVPGGERPGRFSESVKVGFLDHAELSSRSTAAMRDRRRMLVTTRKKGSGEKGTLMWVLR